jgi:hypothetical protein
MEELLIAKFPWFKEHRYDKMRVVKAKRRGIPEEYAHAWPYYVGHVLETGQHSWLNPHPYPNLQPGGTTFWYIRGINPKREEFLILQVGSLHITPFFQRANPFHHHHHQQQQQPNYHPRLLVLCPWGHLAEALLHCIILKRIYRIQCNLPLPVVPLPFLVSLYRPWTITVWLICSVCSAELLLGEMKLTSLQMAN